MADQDHTAKRCPKCNTTKPVSMFGRSKQSKSGLRPWCKDCHNASNKRWREQNPEKARAAVSRWCKANPENGRAKVARWKAKNPERFLQLRAIANDRNRDKNREMWRARRRVPENRIHHTISTRLNSVLRDKATKSTVELIGYCSKELRIHLERQFVKGMSWENYGMWHIDHIVPLSSFKITEASDPMIKVAWGLPNLRPIWAADNIRKKDKRTHLI